MANQNSALIIEALIKAIRKENAPNSFGCAMLAASYGAPFARATGEAWRKDSATIILEMRRRGYGVDYEKCAFFVSNLNPADHAVLPAYSALRVEGGPDDLIPAVYEMEGERLTVYAQRSTLLSAMREPKGAHVGLFDRAGRPLSGSYNAGTNKPREVRGLVWHYGGHTEHRSTHGTPILKGYRDWRGECGVGENAEAGVLILEQVVIPTGAEEIYILTNVSAGKSRRLPLFIGEDDAPAALWPARSEGVRPERPCPNPKDWERLYQMQPAPRGPIELPFWRGGRSYMLRFGLSEMIYFAALISRVPTNTAGRVGSLGVSEMEGVFNTYLPQLIALDGGAELDRIRDISPDNYPDLPEGWFERVAIRTNPGRMSVEIPIVAQHEGYPGYLRILSISDRCPQCGGPRGEAHQGLSYDGSRRLWCDTWNNPCGHVDKYTAVVDEVAAELAAAEAAKDAAIPASSEPEPILPESAEYPLTEPGFWNMVSLGCLPSLSRCHPAALVSYVSRVLSTRLVKLQEYNGVKDAGRGWVTLAETYGGWEEPAPGHLSGPQRLEAIPSLFRSPAWDFAGVTLALYCLTGGKSEHLINALNARGAQMTNAKGGALFVPLSEAWAARIAGLPDAVVADEERAARMEANCKRAAQTGLTLNDSVPLSPPAPYSEETRAGILIREAAEATLSEFLGIMMILCTAEALAERMMMRLRMEGEALTTDFRA